MNENQPLLPVEKPALKSIWKNPDSAAFLDWYQIESNKPEEDQAAGYKKFLEAVANGETSLPSAETLARHRIKDLRA